MSLLIDPPHTARIYVEESTTDSYGNPIKEPSTNVVEIRCVVSPISNQRDSATSRVDATYKLIARDAPLTAWTRVEWNGKTFTVDDIKLHNVTAETQHIAATIREEV